MNKSLALPLWRWAYLAWPWLPRPLAGCRSMAIGRRTIMAQPCVYSTYQYYVVPVQGAGPQVVTSYYPPAQGARHRAATGRPVRQPAARI